MDVIDLKAFYSSSLGRLTRSHITTQIKQNTPILGQETVIGVGFATPYIGIFRDLTERSLCFMPAQQGVIKWPTLKPSKVALIEDYALPLAENSVDKFILAHAIENSTNAELMLGEIFRSLNSNGKVIAIVPNRMSLWARSDHSPFSYGRPFSRAQIITLLRKSGFTPTRIDNALWFPPTHNSTVLNVVKKIDHLRSGFALPIGGVFIIEAIKQVYQPILQPNRRFILPNFKPQLSQATLNETYKE